jgi:hypothetical protein
MPRDDRAKKHGHKGHGPLPGKLKPKLEPEGHPDLPKVFCIGFHKTGTTSLKTALKILGYRVTGPNGRHDKNIGENVEALARRIVPKFDAFQDNPWPIIYRFLDKEYPGSKFILTMRPSDKWIGSVTDHFSKGKPPMREWIYGPGMANPIGNEAVYVERYERHNREVQEYFSGRSRDFMVFDLAAGDGWVKLCAFVGHHVPEDMPFPWRNSKEKREKRVAKHGPRSEVRKARRAERQASGRGKSAAKAGAAAGSA